MLPSLRLSITRAMPPLSPDLEARVDYLWSAALQQRRLFNGQVFCADCIRPEVIEGHWTEYRRVVAQITEPALFPALQVRSLAVCGVVCGPEGVVIGRREPQAVYQAGEWQCPPAGSVDHSVAIPGGADWRAALLAELREELGIGAEHVQSLRPLCLVQHPSGVLDLGVEIQTGLDERAIRAAHAGAAHAEYDRLLIAPLPDVLALVAAQGGRAVPAARSFLSRVATPITPRA